MKAILISAGVVLSFLNCARAAAIDARIVQFCGEHQARVIKLLRTLNLDHAGLEKVKEASLDGDWAKACGELLEYYKKNQNGAWLRRPSKLADKAVIAKADRIVDGYFTVFGVEGKIGRLPDGRKDWTTHGPDNDLEYNALLLRHTYFRDLLAAYLITGDAKYVRFISDDVSDWVLSAKMPAEREYYPVWGAGLECSLRLQSWSAVFFAMQDVDALTPGARLLMLSAISEQANFIVNLGSFRANHVVAEMYGLAQTGLCYPEFKDAAKWLEYASAKMIEQTTAQVYPDGVQKELSSHYHYVALEIFSKYNGLLKTAGRKTLGELDAVCLKMADYLAYAMNPGGFLPLNGDSPLESSRKGVLENAKEYERQDWLYIASNGGEGRKPEKLSVVYPWARQAFMRDGWDANSQWGFFDCGAWGIAHQHSDKLNMEIFAYGRGLLVDSGLYTYKGYRGGDKWRRYFVGSPAHNVVLIDGVGQGSMPVEYKEPMQVADYNSTAEYDYIAGSFTDGFKGVMNTEPIAGKAVHRRKVLYLRGKAWVVVDQIATDRRRKIQALWHFHPDCNVEVQDGSAASVDPNKGNLRITPVSNVEWEVKLVKGQSEPDIQGWYSTDFNIKFANFTAVYQAEISSSATFAWILQPGAGIVPRANAKMLSAGDEEIAVRIELAGKDINVKFPKSGGPQVDYIMN